MLKKFAALATLLVIAATAGAQQNCPNGKCPLQPTRGFVNPIPGPVTVPQQMPAATQLDATPVGSAPGTGYSWQNLPGVGWGWVHDSVESVSPPVSGGPIARLTRKVVCERVRAQAVDRAVANGTPRAEARRKVNAVTDAQILGGAVAMGAPVTGLGDGSVLKWIWEHREELVAFVLKLLALFGDEPVQVGFLDLGDGRFACVAVAGERAFVFAPA